MINSLPIIEWHGNDQELVNDLQIVSVYECNGKNIFTTEVKDEISSIQRGEAELIFHRVKIFFPLHELKHSLN